MTLDICILQFRDHKIMENMHQMVQKLAETPPDDVIVFLLEGLLSNQRDGSGMPFPAWKRPQDTRCEVKSIPPW
jgi:hypothetical protein